LGRSATAKKKSILSVWIITASQCISPQMTVKGFKKCCITNALDENDDDMLSKWQ